MSCCRAGLTVTVPGGIVASMPSCPAIVSAWIGSCGTPEGAEPDVSVATMPGPPDSLVPYQLPARKDNAATERIMAAMMSFFIMVSCTVSIQVLCISARICVSTCPVLHPAAIDLFL